MVFWVKRGMGGEGRGGRWLTVEEANAAAGHLGCVVLVYSHDMCM